MSETTSQQLIHSVEAAFRSSGWQFRQVDGKDVIECEFEAHNAKVPLHVQTFSPGLVSVVSRLSFTISPESRAAVSEALMRTNLLLNLGNFETDYDSGEVFFRVTNVFPDGVAQPTMITSLVHNALVEMDRITPYLSELEKQPGQNVATLLSREDLMPAVGGDEGAG